MAIELECLNFRIQHAIFRIQHASNMGVTSFRRRRPGKPRTPANPTRRDDIIHLQTPYTFKHGPWAMRGRSNAQARLQEDEADKQGLTDFMKQQSLFLYIRQPPVCPQYYRHYYIHYYTHSSRPAAHSLPAPSS